MSLKLRYTLAAATLLTAGSIVAVSNAGIERLGQPVKSQRVATNVAVTKAAPQTLPPSHAKKASADFFHPVTRVIPLASIARKAAPALAQSSSPELTGVSTYSSNSSIWPYSFVRLTTDGNTALNYKAAYYDLEGPRMAVTVNGINYVHDRADWGSGFVDHFIYGFDEDGEMTSFQIADASLDGMDLTTDPTTGAVYALATTADESGYTLSRFTYSGGKVSSTVIAPIGLYYTIAADSNGQLYVIDNKGILYKMDKSNGQVETVGTTGFIPYYVSSATIDPKTNRMFWSVAPSDNTGLLVEVDLQTGAGTLICKYPDNESFVGLEAVVALEQSAPAAVTDLACDFAEGSLSGNVTFTLPTTSISGQPLSGQLDYTVTVGDNIYTGQANPGAAVNVQASVNKSGLHTISAFASNSGGKGAVSSIEKYIGFGTPKAPSGVKAQIDGNVVNLSWSAVTESADGGYVNPADITYTVSRDFKVLAEGLTTTRFSETVATGGDLANMVYTVRAIYKNASSVPATSNNLVTGTATLPWSADFDTASLDYFTIIDANADGKTWSISENFAQVFYNSAVDMDDWLICPPMKMEKGKIYEVALSVAARDAGYPERFEVKIGSAASTEAMTTTLVPATDLTNFDPQTYRVEFSPEVDGVYYVGIHGISDRDRYQLKLYDVAVSDGKLPTTPTAVSNLTARATAPFALSADITLTVPSVTIDGDPLASIDGLVLSRNGQVIKTFGEPKPGETLNCTDEVPEAGTYTYSAIAYLGENASIPAEATIYLGPTVPAMPTGAKITETSPGKVRLTWNPVTTDINGNPVPADAVKYLITDSGNNTFETTDTQWETTVCPANMQGFATFALAAATEAGIGNPYSFDMIAVGAVNQSLNESFANGKTRYNWGTLTLNGNAQWSLANDDSMQDVKSVDGDNGFLYMSAQHTFDAGELLSAKFAITENTSQLSFWTYNVTFASGSTDDNLITLYAREGGEPWTEIFSQTVYKIADGKPGWAKAIVDLTPLMGKTVQFGLCTDVIIASYTIFDCFKLEKPYDVDVAVAGVIAPEKIENSEPFTITVGLTNEGKKDADGLTLELYADGQLAATQEIPTLSPSAKTNITLTTALPAIATEAVSYEVVLKGAPDENPDNNSASFAVEPLLNNLPWVTDLRGTNNDDTRNLEWDAPDMSGYVEPYTEDFESGDSFSQEFGDWIFVDVDDRPIGGFTNYEIPGIEAGVTKAAFILWDATLPTLSDDFNAHSGDKYLAAIFCSDFGTTDNWAISPLLSGNAQTVSFQARSYRGQYAETIEVLYSTGSTEPDDFISLAVYEDLSVDWTRYLVDLPAGARRFAIRSYATNSFMLLLDDVKYEPADGKSALVHSGYNVYRNGKKLNDTPITATSYTDTATGKDEYAVTTVYDSKGESRGSNRVRFVTSSVDNLSTATVTVATTRNSIVISGADGLPVTVCTVDGKTVYTTAAAAATVRVPAAPGIYTLSAGHRSVKVMVK